MVLGVGGFGPAVVGVAHAIKYQSDRDVWKVRGVVDYAPNAISLRRLGQARDRILGLHRRILDVDCVHGAHHLDRLSPSATGAGGVLRCGRASVTTIPHTAVGFDRSTVALSCSRGLNVGAGARFGAAAPLIHDYPVVKGVPSP